MSSDLPLGTTKPGSDMGYYYMLELDNNTVL